MFIYYNHIVRVAKKCGDPVGYSNSVRIENLSQLTGCGAFKP